VFGRGALGTYAASTGEDTFLGGAVGGIGVFGTTEDTGWRPDPTGT
jgi:hypothetical protein